MRELKADILIVGGGMGGVAAALAAAEAGQEVVLTEEYDWLGGQLTSQAVPPDEHSWIEQFGATGSYRELRNRIRSYYRHNYPLTTAARNWDDLNPGAGWVSRLCHEPAVAATVITSLLAPHVSSRRLQVLKPSRPVAVRTDGDRIVSVTIENLESGDRVEVAVRYVLDATETGELLPLSGCEYVTGSESHSDTGEPNAPEVAQPQNMQAITWCFAMDHVDGDHTIDRPHEYDHWRKVAPDGWGGPLLSWRSPSPRTLEIVDRSFDPNPLDNPLLVDADQRVDPGDGNLWTFRRVAARKMFKPGFMASDITLVNWPMTDYFEGSVIDVDDAEVHLRRSRQLSLSALYWMQTEAPRPDGGTGYPGLRLRGDITGTSDGLAQAPYIREARRIRAQYTVVEQDLSLAVRGERGAVRYPDSVGVGMYRIDLHPTTGGDNYLDVGCSPFEIPLGALLPVRMTNLIAAGKSMGTTHITNGCYRLHPVEWNVGEVAGSLAAHCLETGTEPSHIRDKTDRLEDFQARLTARGVELHWPNIVGY